MLGWVEHRVKISTEYRHPDYLESSFPMEPYLIMCFKLREAGTNTGLAQQTLRDWLNPRGTAYPGKLTGHLAAAGFQSLDDYYLAMELGVDELTVSYLWLQYKGYEIRKIEE